MGKVLITGGAGYIGSHIVKLLGEKGYDLIIYDNLSTGHEWAVKYGELVVGDILDEKKLREVFYSNRIDVVIHLAAKVIVSESMDNPLKYYYNNVSGSLTLLHIMREAGVNKIVFSSTAAVYGTPAEIPVRENSSLFPINPYGHSKAIVEKILQDNASFDDFKYIILRYFNVAGADPQGDIGEGKKDATHLITQCVRTAARKQDELKIYGIEYPTADGTCIRDYIHVCDLADIHLLSIEHILKDGSSDIFNCGYNKGYSVLEVINMTKEISKVDFSIKILPRRMGDSPALIADSTKLVSLFNWRAKHDLYSIINTAWLWEKSN